MSWQRGVGRARHHSGVTALHRILSTATSPLTEVSARDETLVLQCYLVAVGRVYKTPSGSVVYTLIHSSMVIRRRLSMKAIRPLVLVPPIMSKQSQE